MSQSNQMPNERGTAELPGPRPQNGTDSAAGTRPAQDRDRGPRSEKPAPGGYKSATLSSILHNYMVVLVLLLMVAIYSILAPDVFFTFDTLRIITSSQAVLIIAVLGLILPFAAGEFDLSFGPVIAWSSTFLAVLTVNLGVSVVIAIPLVLASAVLFGVLNAFFIVRIGVSSLITTLGSGTVITGLTLAISNSQVIAGAPKVLADFATNQFLGLPLPVYLASLLAVVVWLFLDHTPPGRYLYFSGEGREVARLSGLPVDRIRVMALLATAFLSCCAGILNLGRLGSADPNLGSAFLLPGTAAVFLGATVIKPGRFNAWGTVVAVFLLVTGVTGLQMLGGAGWLENIFNGGALILAVAFAQIVGGNTAKSAS